MKHLLLTVALLSSSVLTMSYANASQAEPISVVASFSILADVVKNVGGDHVKVISLVPANGDPHEFEPSPQDAKAVKNAAATFISGEGLEGWFSRLAKASGAKRSATLASAGINTHLFEEDGQTMVDPHVWNSVPNVILWVRNIEKTLVAVDPDSAETYHHNAQRYTKQLTILQRNIHTDINSIPRDKRQILTSHDAFGYYGREYGVTFLAPVGLSTETEATAADVAKLIDQIKAKKVKTYFIENSTDSRLVKQIANATQATPGGELYPESLSAPTGPAPSYIRMMTYNTNQIVKALK